VSTLRVFVVEEAFHVIIVLIGFFFLFFFFFFFFTRNAEGCTPFMQAVCGRAYPAALAVLNSAIKLSTRGEGGETDRAMLMTMLYPSGCTLDNNPLHVLCANDTCSFTWTGADHINQVMHPSSSSLLARHCP
jgi:hypothetical protein